MLEKFLCVKRFVGHTRGEIENPFHKFVNKPINKCPRSVLTGSIDASLYGLHTGSSNRLRCATKCLWKVACVGG